MLNLVTYLKRTPIVCLSGGLGACLIMDTVKICV